LYNEDVLLSSPSYVIITEGVTDCIVLFQAGLPTISPVTVRFKHDDWKRIIPKLRGVKNIYICQDNEVSGVGLSGALDTAEILSENGITTRLIVLPRSEGTDKVDPNSWFLSGGTPEQFKSLIDIAKTPIEIGISSLKPDTSIDELNIILSDIAIKQPMERAKLIDSVAKATKNKVSNIRDQVSYLSKNIKLESKNRPQYYNTDSNFANDNPPDHPDSCKSVIAPYINPPPRTVPPH
jgi:DNA primase